MILANVVLHRCPMCLRVCVLTAPNQAHIRCILESGCLDRSRSKALISETS